MEAYFHFEFFTIVDFQKNFFAWCNCISTQLHIVVSQPSISSVVASLPADLPTTPFA